MHIKVILDLPPLKTIDIFDLFEASLLPMRFTLDKLSVDQFIKESRLHIDGFFNESKLNLLNRLIDKKIGSSFEFKDKVMQNGHNVVIETLELQKALNLFGLAVLSYELTQVKPLKLAYDQFYFGGMDSFDKDRKSSFLENDKPIDGRLSVSDSVIAIYIDLKTGDLTFLKPTEHLPKIDLAARSLMLVFTRINSLYQPCSDDPMDPFLKKKGYAYGDKLKDAYHPVLLREFIS